MSTATALVPLAAVAVALAVAAGPVPPPAPPGAPPPPPAAAAALPGRAPPAPGPPLRAFEAPPHEYGPGHRGVDLAVVAGQSLTAPADATVAFAGPVAGRGVVVLAHDSPQGPTRHALEPVEPLLPVGTPVRLGDPVASPAAGPPHPGCGSRPCVHWGVRVGGRYVDPWWWLGLRGPVRLLPPDAGAGPVRGGSLPP